MKVKIGNYKDSFRVYNIANWCHAKIHGQEYNRLYYLSEKDYNRYDHMIEKIFDGIQKFLDLTINHKIFMKRKIYVRIDKYDTWNMDNTLSYIILPMLKQLKENKQGSPYVDDDDVPEELKSTSAPPKANSWDVDDNHFKRWDYVFDEMIYAFEAGANDDWDEQFYSGDPDTVWIENDNGTLTMENGPKNTFKVDREGMRSAWERRKNGLRLFGKYYHSLWN